MSSEEAVTPLDSSVARALTLRMGFGMLLGFVLSAVFRLDFFFLPSLLAVQMLASMRRPPSLAQGAGIFFLMTMLAVVTLVVSSAFTRQPLIYVTLTGLILFFGFLLDSAGKAMPATFVLMLGATIPLVVVQSTEAATILGTEMIGATAIALLTVWGVFAAFPSTATASSTSVSRPASPRAALTNLLLLVPVLLLFLFDSKLSLVAVIVIVNIVRQRQRGMASQTALGLLFGNVLGGVLATVAYFFISIRSGPIFFLLIVLLVGLMLGGRGAVAGAKAPVYTVALASFIILLGLGVSPLPSETGSLFVERLINVLLAGVYAVSAIALVSSPSMTQAAGVRPPST
jgi:hypothetical protein